jgi:fructoselysine-6-P-deglycase FrlB-like protein
MGERFTTYSELKDQYRALDKTIKYLDKKMDDIKSFYAESDAERLVFLGCGSSYSLAKSGALIAKTKLNKCADAFAAGDLLLHFDSYAKYLEGAIVVAISRSGSTSEMLYCIKELKEKCNVKVVSMICVEQTKLAAISDLVLEMSWAFDASVCQTRTVSCLYAATAYIMASLAGDTKLSEDILKVIESGNKFMLKYEPEIINQAARVCATDWDNVVTLGDGECAGIVEEGALAFKEICQLPSNYYNMLDVRHGPMVMIKPNTMVIILMSSSTNKFELDLISDVQAKTDFVIVYSDLPVKAGKGVYNVVFGEEISHISRGLPFILICQMLSYYKALAIGVNPDNPSGLSPWIKI